MRIRSSPWPWAVALALVTLAVWSPLLRNDFTFDDVIVVLNNDRLRTWRIAWEVFFHPYNWAANPGAVGGLATYRPFELVSYVVDYKLFGLHPFGYHLTRLLLHVGVQLISFFFFLQILRNVRLAFAVAVIGAIHPACAEAMIAPSDLFAALFGMAAIYASCTFSAQPRAWRAVLVGVLFLVTMMAKESGVIYVLVALAFAELERRRVQPAPPPRSTLLPLVGAAALAAIVYAVIRVHALGRQSLPTDASLPRALDAVVGVWYFATQAFFVPINRAPAILDFANTPQSARPLWYVLLVCYALVLAVFVQRRRWLEALGITWWLVALMPSAAATLTPGVWPGLNRWLYAGTPGLLLTITGALSPRLNGRAPTLAWTGLAALFTILSLRASQVWMNDVTLFSAMAIESPDHFWPHRRLGWALYYRGRFADAIPVLQRAAELAPDDERDSCYGLLAASMAGSGDCDGAVQVYRSHRPTPMMELGHFELVEGACWERAGNVGNALRMYRACGAMDPRCPEALERLSQPGSTPASATFPL